MKQSARSRRIQRHQRRMQKRAGLNLVSLMDIFTILVFFLMVNSSDVQVAQQAAVVKLPVSVADKAPREMLTVTVTDTDIIVLGRTVAQLQAVRRQTDLQISGLKKELDYQAGRTEPSKDGSRPITVMADKAIPYQLLKKVMATCVEAGFNAISLAVTKQTEGEV